MADSYAQAKAREALAAAKGSRSVAQSLLMKWAASDDRLLRGMAQPFLKAISAAALEGTLRQASGKPQTDNAGGRLSRDALEQVLSRMGGEPTEPRAAARPLMRSATMAVDRGMDAPGGTNHEDAMKTLAKAFAAKKLR